MLSSLFFLAQTHAYGSSPTLARAYIPPRLLQTHTLQEHQKPSVCKRLHQGPEAECNCRNSGRDVGGVWEDHMHFIRDWWKHIITLLITHTGLSHKKKKRHHYAFIFLFCLLYTPMQQILYKLRMLHTIWNPNSFSKPACDKQK